MAQQGDVEGATLLDLLHRHARLREAQRDFDAACRLEQRHRLEEEPPHGAAAQDRDLGRH
jgi:hypothetical protein